MELKRNCEVHCIECLVHDIAGGDIFIRAGFAKAGFLRVLSKSRGTGKWSPWSPNWQWAPTRRGAITTVVRRSR